MYNNINVELTKHNMSVGKFIQKIGISRSTYYAWQRTGNIPATKLIKMAELFGCSVDYLLGRTEVA